MKSNISKFVRFLVEYDLLLSRRSKKGLEARKRVKERGETKHHLIGDAIPIPDIL
ncbi:MAG: hypothetical protein ACE5L6_08675 [Candidatus Bathyarchaeia archaeon]